MNSPRAIASASFEAATMPPLARAMRRGSGVLGGGGFQLLGDSGSFEASSTRHSSQSRKLWRRTDRNIERSTSAGVS